MKSYHPNIIDFTFFQKSVKLEIGLEIKNSFCNNGGRLGKVREVNSWPCCVLWQDTHVKNFKTTGAYYWQIQYPGNWTDFLDIVCIISLYRYYRTCLWPKTIPTQTHQIQWKIEEINKSIAAAYQGVHKPCTTDKEPCKKFIPRTGPSVEEDVKRQ